MSTNDVPGAKAANKDVLAMGCWAEHSDGSLLFVESTEGGDVIYSMFDLSRAQIVEYRDKMPEKEFKEHFSYDGKNIRWTWHDKTPFPWDRVIKRGASDGTKHASAHDAIEQGGAVARSIAEKLGIDGKGIDPEKYVHMLEKEVPRRVRDQIQASLETCPPGASKDEKRKFRKRQKLLAKRQSLDEKIEALG